MDKTGTVGRCSNDVGIMSLPDGTHVAVSLFVKVRLSTSRSHRDLCLSVCLYSLAF